MALNGTFLMKILDIYSVLSMKDCIIGTTLLLFYLTESQNINKWPLSPGSRQLKMVNKYSFTLLRFFIFKFDFIP